MKLIELNYPKQTEDSMRRVFLDVDSNIFYGIDMCAGVIRFYRSQQKDINIRDIFNNSNELENGLKYPHFQYHDGDPELKVLYKTLIRPTHYSEEEQIQWIKK